MDKRSVVLIVIGVICTALTVLMTTSIATQGYVDRQIDKAEKKHFQEIYEIKGMIQRIDESIYKISVNVPKN